MRKDLSINVGYSLINVPHTVEVDLPILDGLMFVQNGDKDTYLRTTRVEQVTRDTVLMPFGDFMIPEKIKPTTSREVVLVEIPFRNFSDRDKKLVNDIRICATRVGVKLG